MDRGEVVLSQDGADYIVRLVPPEPGAFMQRNSASRTYGTHGGQWVASA